MKISLVILNLNEEVGLRSILPKINLEQFHEVVVVDGGSTDSSLEIIESFGIKIIPQTSRGRGEAFSIAFNKLSGTCDAIVFFSSDGNEDYCDLGTFIDYLNKGYDLVIASRMLVDSRNEEDDKLLKFRKWGNIFFAKLAFLLFGNSKEYISDPINGFRAITCKKWFEMAPSSKGFSIEFEISIKAYKSNSNYAEFATIEGDRIGGESSAKSVRTTMVMARTLIKELFN
jgi:glycosyltransferase involved in cell wall biosynthesis